MESVENKNITRLYKGDKEIILIGTAHVSKESVRLVEEVIHAEKPDTVCVELCESRLQTIKDKALWREMDIVKVIKEKKSFLLLSNLLLASFQKRIAEKLDVVPGQEMIKAVEAGEAEGSAIIPADRDIGITLTRTWRNVGLWARLKMLFQLLLSVVGGLDEINEEEIERMKQEDILTTLLAELGESFPELRTILIDERDRYLCRKIMDAPGNKIVAVVGAGHVPGIRNNWDADDDISELESAPSGGKGVAAAKWIFPAAVVALFGYGFFSGGSDVGADMVKYWFLANGILSATGAVIALAHPLTILTALLAAPLTSLNPLLAAGWVSGLVEALLRKPKVHDFETLSDDIRSVKGFWRNKVTRILLVVVFTNLGSTIGTLVAIPLITKSFSALLILAFIWIVVLLIANRRPAEKKV